MPRRDNFRRSVRLTRPAEGQSRHETRDTRHETGAEADAATKPTGPASAAVLPAVAALAGALFGPANADFARLAAALVAELAPTTVAELVYAELAAEALGRLREAKRAEAGAEPGDAKTSRARGQATRDFHKAMSELDKRRRPAKSAEPRPKAKRRDEEAEEVVEQPEPEVFDGPEPDVSEPHPDWRSRIVLDPAYSTKWPIIKGTTIEAEDIVAALDGGTGKPSELLRRYPGLTVEDIRACLACDAAGKCGPFQPWDPPDAFQREGPIVPRAYPLDLYPIPKPKP